MGTRKDKKRTGKKIINEMKTIVRKIIYYDHSISNQAKILDKLHKEFIKTGERGIYEEDLTKMEKQLGTLKINK